MPADRGVREAAASCSNGRLSTYFGWLQIGDGGVIRGVFLQKGPTDGDVCTSLSPIMSPTCSTSIITWIGATIDDKAFLADRVISVSHS